MRGVQEALLTESGHADSLYEPILGLSPGNSP